MSAITGPEQEFGNAKDGALLTMAIGSMAAAEVVPRSLGIVPMIGAGAISSVLTAKMLFHEGGNQ
jgi:hypothetical protein